MLLHNYKLLVVIIFLFYFYNYGYNFIIINIASVHLCTPRFETLSDTVAMKDTPPPTDQVLHLTTDDVRKTLLSQPTESYWAREHTWLWLRECADQPADGYHGYLQHLSEHHCHPYMS